MRVTLVVEGTMYSRLGGSICKHVMLDIALKIDRPVQMDYIITIVIPNIVKIFTLGRFLIVMYRHSVNVPDLNRRL